jgi:hypothetical protein
MARDEEEEDIEVGMQWWNDPRICSETANATTGFRSAERIIYIMMLELLNQPKFMLQDSLMRDCLQPLGIALVAGNYVLSMRNTNKIKRMHKRLYPAWVLIQRLIRRE